MDKVVQPDLRKWITDPIHLGDTMDAMLKDGLEMGLITKFGEMEAQRKLMSMEKGATGLSSNVGEAKVDTRDKEDENEDDVMDGPFLIAVEDAETAGTSAASRSTSAVLNVRPTFTNVTEMEVFLKNAKMGDEFFDVKKEADPKIQKKKGAKGKKGQCQKPATDRTAPTASTSSGAVGVMTRRPLKTGMVVVASGGQDEQVPSTSVVQADKDSKFNALKKKVGEEHPGTLPCDEACNAFHWNELIDDDSDFENEDGLPYNTRYFPTVDSSGDEEDEDGLQNFMNQIGYRQREKMDGGGGEGEGWNTRGDNPEAETDDGDSSEPEDDMAFRFSHANVDDQPDTLTKWLKQGVKSGPHRLLSSEKKFSSHMTRAFSEKTNRERKYAENYQAQALLGGMKKFKKLQMLTSPALSAVRGESFMDKPVVQGTVMPVLIPPIPDADKIDLKTIGVLLCSTNPTGPIWRSNNVQQQINDDLKFTGKQAKSLQRLQDYADGKPGLVDNSRDFIVEVSVFGGRNIDESLPIDVKLYTEPKLVYKLNLLGTNSVMDLRNALHCDNDLVATKEVEHYDDGACGDEILKYKLPTWMLLLDNNIYGESEDEDAFAALTGWIDEKPCKNLGPFYKGDNQALLRDLTVRMGYPYVYIHVGKCEHIIAFNVVRQIAEDDEHRIEMYPVMATIPNLKNIYCRVDNEHMATWSVMGCGQFPEDPMLICTTCLKEFCYNADGTKRMPFRLFPFRQLANEI